MQLAQTGILETVELHSKLNLGGKWYYRGDNVQVSSEDAAALRSRGLAAAAKEGAAPSNIIKVPKHDPVGGGDKVKLADAIIAPSVDATDKGTRHGNGSGKRR